MIICEPFKNKSVGENLANGFVWQKSARKRRIVRMGLVGGTAPCDSAVDVFYGTQQVAHLENFHCGKPDKRKLLWNTTELYLSPNTPLNIQVTDAFPQDTVWLFLDIKNVR